MVAKKRVKKSIKKIKKFLIKEEKDKKAELERVIGITEENSLDYTREKLLKTLRKNTKKYSHLPYIWGGLSPTENFLKRLLGRKQPPGSWRKGQSFYSGFDCSGWVQYNLRKIGIGKVPYLKKLNCNDFYKLRTEKGNVGEIIKKAKPGDLIVFNQRDRDPEHIAFYLGKGRINESAGTKKPRYSDPKWLEEYEKWEKNSQSEKYGKIAEDMGGIQKDFIYKYGEKFEASLIPLEKLQEINLRKIKKAA